MSEARIAFQACSFIRLRSRSEIGASYGEMSRRSGSAAKADNHSDISPCLLNQSEWLGSQPGHRVVKRPCRFIGALLPLCPAQSEEQRKALINGGEFTRCDLAKDPTDSPLVD